MRNHVSHEEDANLEKAFQALRQMDIPPTPAIKIDDILEAQEILSIPSVPAFEFSPALLGAILITGLALAVVAVPFIKKPEKVSGIPTSCLVQSVFGPVTTSTRKPDLGKQAAHAGMFLEERTFISTGPGAIAQVRAGKDVAIELVENTTLLLKTLRVDPEAQSKNLVFHLTDGHIYCKVDKNIRPVNLTIQTPEASFTVWGTHFEIIEKPGTGSHLGVFEGDVLVTPAKRDIETFHVTGGFQTQVLAKKQFRKPVIRPFENARSPESFAKKSQIDLAQSPTSPESNGILLQEVTASGNLASVEQVYEDKTSSD